ncbi:hypothetical protein [Nonlabens xiamenensis]|uniref:hypothetical protein n=1 Tax=Nonlabens xiamenensis TaxID=2341043 RepID=UPI000F6073B7|nr:hypothetical protein [Nonlabens xiamenensis]
MKNVLVLFTLLVVPAFAKAQCAMCRAVIESSGDNATAEGLNNGITWLMAFPYLTIGAIIYMIYRSTNKTTTKEN